MVQVSGTPVQPVSSHDSLSVFPFGMSISPKVGGQPVSPTDHDKTAANDPSSRRRSQVPQQQGAVLFQQHYDALQRAYPPNLMTGSRQNSKPLNSEEFEPHKQVIGFDPSCLMVRTQSLPMVAQETLTSGRLASMARASSLPTMRLPDPAVQAEPEAVAHDQRVIGYFPSIGGIDREGYVLIPPKDESSVPAPLCELPTTPHHQRRSDQDRLVASFEMREDWFFEHPGY